MYNIKFNPSFLNLILLFAAIILIGALFFVAMYIAIAVFLCVIVYIVIRKVLTIFNRK